MEYFENFLLPSIVDFNIVWYRYVDDVFAVLPGDIDIGRFLSQLNNLSPTINFKVENEFNNALNFLDVTIHRDSNNSPRFSIYRKPTHSNLYIHSFSNHANNVKLGAITSIFLRAYMYTVCVILNLLIRKLHSSPKYSQSLAMTIIS